MLHTKLHAAGYNDCETPESDRSLSFQGSDEHKVPDEIDLSDGQTAMLFGVFDGHAGDQVSKFVKLHFKDTLIESHAFKFQQYKLALEQCFMQMDVKLKQNNVLVAGCTANVVLVTPDKIYCANAGDSRSVLCRQT